DPRNTTRIGPRKFRKTSSITFCHRLLRRNRQAGALAVLGHLPGSRHKQDRERGKQEGPTQVDSAISHDLAPGSESIDAHAARHEPSSHPLPTVTRDEAARRSQEARGEFQYRPDDIVPHRGILIGHGREAEDRHTGRGQQEVAIVPKDVASSKTGWHYIPTPCSFSLRWSAAVVPSCKKPSRPTPF